MLANDRTIDMCDKEGGCNSCICDKPSGCSPGPFCRHRLSLPLDEQLRLGPPQEPQDPLREVETGQSESDSYRCGEQDCSEDAPESAAQKTAMVER